MVSAAIPPHTASALPAGQRRWGITAGALVVLMPAALRAMGRVWWCEQGDWLPWSWDIWSPHNSQHVVDPYTLSHIQHGLSLYLLLTLAAGQRLSIGTRVAVVALVEATWELAENTNWMIERYRSVTISLDYYGDSIINSMGDYASCLAGVVFAIRNRAWIGWSVFVALELISVWWIRDSLLLNILMLVCPIDAVRQWQSGIA